MRLHGEMKQRYGYPEAFIVALAKRMKAAGGVSQKQLAHEADLDVRTVERMFARRNEPSLETMVRLDGAMERLEEDAALRSDDA